LDDSALPVAVRAVVEGRVQGVGFRGSAREAAARLRVVGWVRNADDGTVEVYAEGPRSAVDSFLEWLRAGPPGARVDALKVEAAVPSGAYRGFAIER